MISPMFVCLEQWECLPPQRISQDSGHNPKGIFGWISPSADHEIFPATCSHCAMLSQPLYGYCTVPDCRPEGHSVACLYVALGSHMASDFKRGYRKKGGKKRTLNPKHTTCASHIFLTKVKSFDSNRMAFCRSWELPSCSQDGSVQRRRRRTD